MCKKNLLPRCSFCSDFFHALIISLCEPVSCYCAQQSIVHLAPEYVSHLPRVLQLSCWMFLGLVKGRLVAQSCSVLISHLIHDCSEFTWF
jgi:hypothetical protein